MDEKGLYGYGLVRTKRVESQGQVGYTLVEFSSSVNEWGTLHLIMAARRKKSRRKVAKKRPVPTNPALYARVKAQAKRKFKVYPSAYANGWLVKTYKAKGGRYRMGTGRKRK